MSIDRNLRGASTLTELGFIRVSGPDADTFLNAQLGRDVPESAGSRAPLAGWHDPQGRVRALFRILPHGADWLLITPKSAVAETVSALGRFVLRARVSIADQSAAFAGIGLLAPAAEELPPALGVAPGSLAVAEACAWVRLGPRLVEVFGEPAALAPLLERFDPVTSEAIALAEIELGLTRLEPGLASRYLAQMLGLDRLGAVSFDKGCYPGQEVITRAERRGTIKRGLRRYAAAPSAVRPQLGTRLLDAAGEEVGEVVRAASDGASNELLAVVRVAESEGSLHLEDSATTLEHRPLPWEAGEPERLG